MKSLKKSSRPKSKGLSKPLKADTYHHGDLRTTLIETAVRMLKTKASAEISLRELAREAGVSQAAPYRHFKDKNQLLAAVCQQGFDLKFQYMVEAVQTAKTPEELIHACGIAYFRMGLKHPQHFKLMVNSEIQPSPDYPELEKAACKSFLVLKQVIEQCQKAGLMGEGDPYHRAMNCWCLVNGFTALYAEGRLAWLGVTEKNAEAALSNLISQHLYGSQHPLSRSGSGFRIFSTPESQQNKEQLTQMEAFLQGLHLLDRK